MNGHTPYRWKQRAKRNDTHGAGSRHRIGAFEDIRRKFSGFPAHSLGR
jgi:hypothetical protein